MIQYNRCICKNCNYTWIDQDHSLLTCINCGKTDIYYQPDVKNRLILLPFLLNDAIKKFNRNGEVFEPCFFCKECEGVCSRCLCDPAICDQGGSEGLIANYYKVKNKPVRVQDDPTTRYAIVSLLKDHLKYARVIANLIDNKKTVDAIKRIFTEAFLQDEKYAKYEFTRLLDDMDLLDFQYFREEMCSDCDRT